MLYKNIYFRNEEELAKVKAFIKRMRLEEDLRGIGVDVSVEEEKADESFKSPETNNSASPDPDDEDLWYEPAKRKREGVPAEVPELLIKFYQKGGITVEQCIEAERRYEEWLNTPGASGLNNSLDKIVREVIAEGEDNEEA